ncbi:MAG: hypothetical protein Aureis2KO_11270 [Aureisphaera sp.]
MIRSKRISMIQNKNILTHNAYFALYRLLFIIKKAMTITALTMPLNRIKEDQSKDTMFMFSIENLM